ncbi:MepB family protein [Pedobacter sp. UBA4863]|uniref:MepB family protein n=1 Tax=Pedobacter sp. UBA4863 TaxID=1947060 RepID=UPI0025DE0E98|nr:MepB family protein [Pedobacter sp. UBA4863]
MYSQLKKIKEELYDKCDLSFTSLVQKIESTEYSACSFRLNEYGIVYRQAKITPKKMGQFVAIWKRDKNGITQPYDISDDFDFMIITTIKDDKIGQFIFPKQILKEKGIVSLNGKSGKRGIRVYPPWDIVTNAQAKKSQNWQVKYFLSIEDSNRCLERLMINKA